MKKIKVTLTDGATCIKIYLCDEVIEQGNQYELVNAEDFGDFAGMQSYGSVIIPRSIAVIEYLKEKE